MKVPKQFSIYIPKNVEGILVGVGGPEASGSVLADCQLIGRGSYALRAMRLPYSSSFCWICSVGGVFMVSDGL